MQGTLKVSYAMILIAHCCLSFAALQFVVITSYYVYGLLLFCKQIVLMVFGATASVYPASCWVV